MVHSQGRHGVLAMLLDVEELRKYTERWYVTLPTTHERIVTTLGIVRSTRVLQPIDYAMSHEIYDCLDTG